MIEVSNNFHKNKHHVKLLPNSAFSLSYNYSGTGRKTSVQFMNDYRVNLLSLHEFSNISCSAANSS